MSALGWALVLWLPAGLVVGVVFGRMARERDRVQAPRVRVQERRTR